MPNPNPDCRGNEKLSDQRNCLLHQLNHHTGQIQYNRRGNKYQITTIKFPKQFFFEPRIFDTVSAYAYIIDCQINQVMVRNITDADITSRKKPNWDTSSKTNQNQRNIMQSTPMNIF